MSTSIYMRLRHPRTCFFYCIHCVAFGYAIRWSSDQQQIIGTTMSYMRIASDMIQKRGQDEPRVRREYASGYYFTLSKWQGMAYLSDRLIIEDVYVDPYQVFPAKAKASMFYGQRHGLVLTAMQYKDVAGVKKGALAMVESGNHVLGFYAVRYD